MTLKVAVVLGDDLLPRADELRELGISEMDSGAALPATIASMNAYLGGFPIARALGEGADVVITGRCVDSAVTLGALIHEFGWTHGRPRPAGRRHAVRPHHRMRRAVQRRQLHRLASWCRTTTTWASRSPRSRADGCFVLGKPDGTGGLITPATVAEQMLYEIGDPRAYIVPDVVCDFTEVRYEQVGKDRVRVSGAKGRPPTDTYKVSPPARTAIATWPSCLGRREAVAKGRHSGEAIIKRRSACSPNRACRPSARAHRDHRRRGHLRPARAAHLARGRGEDRGQARPEGGAELLGREIARPAPDVVGMTGLRRRPIAVAGDPHVLLPGAQERGAGADRGGRQRRSRWPSRRTAASTKRSIGAARRYAATPAIEGFSSVPLMRWRTAARATRATTPTSASSRASPSTCRSSTVADARARWRSTSAQRIQPRRALRPAGLQRHQLPAARRAGRRRHGLAAHRQPGQVLCAGAAVHGSTCARRHFAVGDCAWPST